MDEVQKLLYGTFPRDAATPSRFTLFNEDHFDAFVESASGTYNLYSSISMLHPTKGALSDKVSFDFDTPYKNDGKITHPEVRPDEPHALIFNSMRRNEGLASDILGHVLQDAQALVEESQKRGIPLVGVFTGFGIHIHLLYQPKWNAYDEMYSTANMFHSELNLETSDRVIYGDVQRILKIPNTIRVENRGGESFPCNVWNIPLTADEILETSPSELLEMSTRSRGSIPLTDDMLDVDNRPQMEVYEDYMKQNFTIDSGMQYFEDIQPRKLIEYQAPEECEWLIRTVIPMPCMQEHLLQPNPDHKIRQNFVVMMYNSGFKPDEVHEIIKKMKWKDYKPSTTNYQLRQIWNTKYTDMSCDSMWREGYCMYPDKPTECPTYKWRGGSCEY